MMASLKTAGLVVFAVVCGLFVLAAFVVLTGCATMKHVVRTIDDVATSACVLFGQQNPKEFAFLVEQVAPAAVPKLEQSGFNVQDACAIHEVLKPFIDSQLDLQHETAASVRESMRSPNANPAE